MTFAPCWYWLSASSLPLPGLRNAAGVTPAYCTITVQSGQAYFTPALYPASNFQMSGTSMPPTNPTFLEPPTIAASAPTTNEPSSSLNLSAATLGGGGIGLPDLSVDTE